MASNQIKEKKETKKPKLNAENKNNLFFEILGGTILTKSRIKKLLPFALYIMFLAIIYIANNYYADRNIRQINKLNKEINELRAEYITIKAELMFKSNQTELAKKLEQYGIKESIVPPKKIIKDKKYRDWETLILL